MKQSSSNVSTLAALVLSGKLRPTKRQTMILAASVLAQDETPGQKQKAKPKSSKRAPRKASKV
jgi:hypothetical protein